MRITLVAGREGDEAVTDLERSLEAIDATVARLDLSAPSGATPLERMASAFRDAEAALTAEPTDGVVLTGDDDHSLAAALVATKLEIPLFRVEAIEPVPGAAARIASLLADAVVPAKPVDAAAAIVESLAATPAPGERDRL